ncbi:hypothetical protein LCGC14_1319180 [marine sediment metagenome]|uniref:HNH domain-containing protein n=1 Tax=marine sediment metagenome TaxID=412755 RepID=A0A0F9N0T9_9ZZZZ
MKKQCSMCMEEKDLSCFGAQVGGKFGKRGRCKICRAKTEGKSEPDAYRKKRWYENNRELCLRRASNNYQDNRANKLEYQKEYTKKNKDKISKYKKIYHKNNKIKCANARRRRRAHKAKVQEKYDSIDGQITKMVFKNKCFKCNSNVRLAIDHHKPLSKGFALNIKNAAVLCGSCNSRKGTKMPDDFYSITELLEINILFKIAYSIKKEIYNDQIGFAKK